MNKVAVSETTREVAHAFVAGHFDNESSLFDVFWDVFSSRWNFGATECSAHEIETAIRDVSFAKDSAVDLVTPVVLATVAATIQKVGSERLSIAEIKKVVGSAAKKFHAGRGLLDCLVRHLPALCKEAFAVRDDAEEAEPQIEEADSTEMLWVEHCDSLGKPHEIPSASANWYAKKDVDSKFRSECEKYDLFVDEFAPAIYLAKEDKSVDWSELHARHKKLLGVILKSLRMGGWITNAVIYDQIFSREHEEVQYNPFYDDRRIQRALSELNRILCRMFKTVVVAEPNMRQYEVKGKLTYCWIRRSKRTSRLLPPPS
jgi:hypothetical protein